MLLWVFFAVDLHDQPAGVGLLRVARGKSISDLINNKSICLCDSAQAESFPDTRGAISIDLNGSINVGTNHHALVQMGHN